MRVWILVPEGSGAPFCGAMKALDAAPRLEPRGPAREKHARIIAFEKELAVVVAEQWKGCSATVMCVLDNHRAVPLSECQRAAARGASSVDIEGSTAQLADLGFDEHDRDGTPSVSEGLLLLRTWELEPEPEQGLEFEPTFEPEPEP